MATIARPVRTTTEANEPRGRSRLSKAAAPWLKNPFGLIGLVIVVAFVFLGLFGPYLAPHDPRALDVTSRNLGPSLEHPFGTTNLGQDMFSRVLAGARISFTFSVLIMIFGFIPGTALGIVSGYATRWIDQAIQRSGEAWSALPQLPILLTVIAAIGPGLTGVIVVVAISALFGGSRLLRALTMVEKNKDYVLAARALGCGETHTLRRHILPNIMPYILIGASSVFALAILAEATLAFLGLGVETGTPSWGGDLSANIDEGTSSPYLVIFPGLVITIVVLGFTLLGDTLRDILDPRLRGSS
jgi:peptide/nickel transport system permease protein